MNYEEEIALLKERNKRVDADKAWEISIFRKSFIALSTYIITASVFYIIGVSNYFLNALIPTLGYVLSTQTIPLVKKWWVDRYCK